MYIIFPQNYLPFDVYTSLFLYLFVCLMVFNTTFNNISVISWQSVLLVEDPDETTDLSRVTDKLYHIMLYTSPWLKFELTTSVVIGTDCIQVYITRYKIPCHLMSTFLNFSFTASGQHLAEVPVATFWLFCMMPTFIMICTSQYSNKNFVSLFFLVHLDQRSRWTIAITWRPSSVVCRLSSVNFSHFKLLLRNHWADWNQT
jgi:hypothetical protein